jgi:nucleoside-diphosphate-sugar epimerase
MDWFVTGGSGFVGGALLDRLDREDHGTWALARSEGSAQAVASRGAQVVRGDLHDEAALGEGAEAADVVVHAAAVVEDEGDRELHRRVNVEGTRNVAEAAREAGVEAFVHVSTEAVLVEPGRDLRDVDETWPRAEDPVGAYAWSKGLSEEVVEEEAGESLRASIVRPRFVWGPGDATILPAFRTSIEDGSFAWIGGGGYPFSTTHVRNAVEGILRVAEAGEPGEAYFVTDGAPVELRGFLTRYLEAHGVTPPDRSVPRPLAVAGARAAETAWRFLPLPGEPPLTRASIELVGKPVTIDDGKARRELGYEPVVSVEDGLRELENAARNPF